MNDTAILIDAGATINKDSNDSYWCPECGHLLIWGDRKGKDWQMVMCMYCVKKWMAVFG